METTFMNMQNSKTNELDQYNSVKNQYKNNKPIRISPT